MSNEFTLVNESGILFLERNGIKMNCPFKTSAPVQQSGGLGFANQTCDSMCPLFRWEQGETLDGEKSESYFVSLCKCSAILCKMEDRKIHSLNKIIN